MLVGSLLLISATSVLAQTLAAQRVSESARDRFPIDIVLLAAMIGGFIFLLPRAGFVISAFALLVGTLSIYGMPGWWRRVGTACAMTAVSYLVFTLGLSVHLPNASWLN
jgi:cell division protein FtsW (lipid II flippase)